MRRMTEVSDPAAAVHLCTPAWVNTFAEVMASNRDAATVVRQRDGLWSLHARVQRTDGLWVPLTVPFNVDGGPVIAPDGELLRWGALALGIGVWQVQPSLVVEDHFHGYLVLIGVPHPAPWFPPGART